jgi:hypothetical protein
MMARLKLIREITKVDMQTKDLSRNCVWRERCGSGILANKFIIEYRGLVKNPIKNARAAFLAT